MLACIRLRVGALAHYHSKALAYWVLLGLGLSALSQVACSNKDAPQPTRPQKAISWSEIRQAPEQLRFNRPSDVLATWRSWHPDEGFAAPLSVNAKLTRDYDPPRLDALHGYVVLAGSNFDDEATAFVALGACLPPAAWVVFEQSPMLWVLEHGGQWKAPNDLDFGGCVRKRSQENMAPGRSSPDTAGGIRAAVVLEKKLTDYLLKNRCSGKGPDDCLTLLDALLSLSPSSPRLISVLQAVAKDFPPLTGSFISPDLGVKQRVYEGPVWEKAQTIRRRLMEQVLYLTLRLRIFAVRPNQIDLPGEPAATFSRLMPLVKDLSQLDSTQANPWPHPRIDRQWPFANPWQVVPDTAAYPAWDQAIADLGTHAAQQTVGVGRGQECPSAPQDSLNPLPNAYWRGYWIAALKAGPGQCPPQGDTGWVSSYIEAADSDDIRLKRFEPLRSFLGDESRADAHLALVAPLRAHCPMAKDPWEICQWAGTEESKRWQTNPPRRLPVPLRKRFMSETLTVGGMDSASPGARFDVSLARLQRREGRALTDVQALLAEIQKAGVPELVIRWWHPASPVRAVQLTLPTTGKAGTDGQQALILYGVGIPAKLVYLPGGFGQYDEGELAAISDVDGDGRLEVWFSGVWGECDGEDLIPGKDCSITLYHLGGEVFGDRLGPYIKGRNPSVNPLADNAR